MPHHFTLRLLFAALLSSTILAQDQAKKPKYLPELQGAKVEVYKTIGDVNLNMFIFTPEDHKPSDERAAAVFFFGGGWKGGTPKQFEQHCKYLASRGMVAMTADYRVLTRHGTKAKECVADAKSAIRWVRREAKRLGVDPNRIIAGGGSAGGHIAGCTGTIEGFEESGEDSSISSGPNAMALFNPALALAPINGKLPLRPDKMRTLPERVGVEPKELSPYHHVKAGVPPTIIFHGKSDETVSYMSADRFTAVMKRSGNRCELFGYPDQPHGFFNYGRSDNKYFVATLKDLDKFLVSLEYLAGPATIE